MSDGAPPSPGTTRALHPGVPPPGAIDGSTVEAITFDFGNTLVRFSDAQMRLTLERSIAGIRRVLPSLDPERFAATWREERDRQIREEVPEGREVNMDVRFSRVLARLRGAAEPRDGERWRDEDVAALSTPAEIAACLDAYVDAFLATTPVPEGIGPMLERLASRHRLAILSNWPLTAAIERYAERAGWSEHLAAIVVSHSVGCIKPLPGIFEAAARALGIASGTGILHVGDDLGADVAGAHRVGWRAAWIAVEPGDSPLPRAEVSGDVAPDLILPDVLRLEQALLESPAT